MRRDCEARMKAIEYIVYAIWAAAVIAGIPAVMDSYNAKQEAAATAQRAKESKPALQTPAEIQKEANRLIHPLAQVRP
jgi:hypothetical protein